MKDFISLKQLSKANLNCLIELVSKIKKNPKKYAKTLEGKDVGLLFEKPSLRTKASFYLGAKQLGANVIYFSPNEVNLGKREKISDAARTLDGYLDCAVIRTFSHSTIEEFSHNFKGSVVNALSDAVHPSQVLGDLFTLYEYKKSLSKIKFSYIGDGNNVSCSLLYGFAILGGNISIATPPGYGIDKKVLADCKKIATKSGAKIEITTDVTKCAKSADVLYTDVWTSMGKEKESSKRKKLFKSFALNEKVVKLAKKDCLIMHCLPAHRGEEISDSVIDGKNSIVFLQAENRLHSAKAILFYLIGGKK